MIALSGGHRHAGYSAKVRLWAETAEGRLELSQTSSSFVIARRGCAIRIGDEITVCVEVDDEVITRRRMRVTSVKMTSESDLIEYDISPA